MCTSAGDSCNVTWIVCAGPRLQKSLGPVGRIHVPLSHSTAQSATAGQMLNALRNDVQSAAQRCGWRLGTSRPAMDLILESATDESRATDWPKQDRSHGIGPRFCRCVLVVLKGQDQSPCDGTRQAKAAGPREGGPDTGRAHAKKEGWKRIIRVWRGGWPWWCMCVHTPRVDGRTEL